MSHTFRSHYFHLVWSTKNRHDWIMDEIKPHLYSYMGGIIKNYRATLLGIGGTADHVHLLISCNTLDSFSYLVRDVKSSSSRFLHKNYSEHSHFAWQSGYGSFSTNYSSLSKIKKYIANQEEHHKLISFDEEFQKLLQKHEIEFDDRFVFG